MEVIEFITLDVPALTEQPSTELINLRNGLDERAFRALARVPIHYSHPDHI